MLCAKAKIAKLIGTSQSLKEIEKVEFSCIVCLFAGTTVLGFDSRVVIDLTRRWVLLSTFEIIG
ncbi:MAG TPA: hypothetical protein VFQ47_00915, partial [Nitrososphaera sp.]|jgi:hypothetical protein|nr:hypothetical protein [Nitrososphaera sp.]